MRVRRELTHDKIQQLLHYDPETGVFTWRVHRYRYPLGSVAGHAAAKGYLAIGVLGKTYKAHRLAWFYTYGVWPSGQIDHKDLDRTNNSLRNLRDVTNSVNKQNSGAARSDNSLGVPGVNRRCKSFAARIGVDGKSIHLGTYKTLEAAGQAYVEAKKRLHPGYLNHIAPSGGNQCA